MLGYDSPLKRVPLLRLLLPFVLGIMLCCAIPKSAAVWIFATIGVVAVFAAIYLHFVCEPMRKYRLSILPIATLAFALGMADAVLTLPPDLGECYEADVPITGVIIKVKQNEASTSLMVRTAKTGVVSILVGENQYGYSEGDRIAFLPNLKRIKNMGNPWEFDYAGYMKLQYCAYSQYVGDAREVVVVGHSSSPYYWLQHMRYGVRTKILNSQITTNAKSLICALLLGYGADIDAGFRTQLSKSGVAHAVALSGLHVGLVAMLVAWLMMPLLRRGRIAFRVVCSAFAVVAFAFFTGLSPSVSRSAIMMAFAAVAMLSGRRAMTLNALLGASLLILAISPSAIYDVGFLLSFATVASIVVAMPWLAERIVLKNRAVRYIVYSVMVSIVASVSSAGISAYYFHTVPVLSFVANLIVLPFLPVYMAVSGVYVALLVSGVDVVVVAWTIDAITDAFASVVMLFSRFGLTHIDNVWMTLPEVWAYYIAIIAIVAIFVVKHKVLPIIVTLVTTIVGMLIHILGYIGVPQEGMVIMNAYDSTPVFYFSNHKGYVWCPDREIDVEAFARSYDAMLCRLDIEVLTPIKRPCMVGENLFETDYACIMGKKIVAINGKYALKRYVGSGIKADWVVMTRKCNANLADNLSQVTSGNIVLSGGMWNDNLKKFEQTLCRNHILYHSLKSGGAITCF